MSRFALCAVCATTWTIEPKRSRVMIIQCAQRVCLHLLLRYAMISVRCLDVMIDARLKKFLASYLTIHQVTDTLH